MKYIILTIATGVLGVVGLIHAQPKRGVPKPPPVAHHEPNPEEYWACGPNTRQDRNGDHCHCPAMVAEVNNELAEACENKYGTGQGNKAYIDCLSKIPMTCDIVANADLKHPAHTCKRSCNKNAICRCHDGPACVGPPIYQRDEEDQQ